MSDIETNLGNFFDKIQSKFENVDVEDLKQKGQNLWNQFTVEKQPGDDHPTVTTVNNCHKNQCAFRKATHGFARFLAAIGGLISGAFALTAWLPLTVVGAIIYKIGEQKQNQEHYILNAGTAAIQELFNVKVDVVKVFTPPNTTMKAGLIIALPLTLAIKAFGYAKHGY